MNLVKVSVIIPTYNRKEEIKDAIASLSKQTYPPELYEVVVVDDGSTDGTINLLQKLSENTNINLKFLYQENKGPGAARNHGIKFSNGDIICFMDSDCIADPKWIEAHVRSYTEKDIGGVGGSVLPYDASSLISRYADLYEYQLRVFKNNLLKYVNTSNASFRRSVLEVVNGFDENIIYTEDKDLSIRVRKAGYKLKFSEDAIIFHKHRRSMFDMLRRSYCYAKYGSYLLYKKYPDDFSFYLALVYANLRIMINIIFYPYFFVKSLLSDDVLLNAARPVIQSLILLSRVAGWLSAAIYYNSGEFKMISSKDENSEI